MNRSPWWPVEQLRQRNLHRERPSEQPGGPNLTSRPRTRCAGHPVRVLQVAPPGSVSTSRYETFDIATDVPLHQRDVYGSTARRKSDARPGTSVEPHFGALKDESVAGFSRGRVRMRGIVKTRLMVAADGATANRRFAMAWTASMVRSLSARSTSWSIASAITTA